MALFQGTILLVLIPDTHRRNSLKNSVVTFDIQGSHWTLAKKSLKKAPFQGKKKHIFSKKKAPILQTKSTFGAEKNT